MCERDKLPSHGNIHAILIALFDAKKQDGRFVSKENLKIAMMEEQGDQGLSSDDYVWVEISRLRVILREIGGKFSIETKRKFGYRIVETETNSS